MRQALALLLIAGFVGVAGPAFTLAILNAAAAVTARLPANRAGRDAETPPQRDPTR